MLPVRLKPAVPKAVVLDPEDGSRLPDSGALKELTPYWRRLLFHGDVVEVTEGVAKPKRDAAKE